MGTLFDNMPTKPPSNRPWDFVFVPENVGKKVSIYDCFYCGLKDGRVECGGIYYCPNGLCDGPGSGWFNRTLKSYKDLGSSGYTIDHDERVEQWKKLCEDARGAIEMESGLKKLTESLSVMEKAATPGFWMVDHGLNYTKTKKGTRFQHILGAQGKGICNTTHYDEVRVNGELLSEQRHGRLEDALFIAASRNAMPTLLAIIEELRRGLAAAGGEEARKAIMNANLLAEGINSHIRR